MKKLFKISIKQYKYGIYLVGMIIASLIIFNTYITFNLHNKVKNKIDNPGRWPYGTYIYDPEIGFDIAPNISGFVRDKSFYVKSHSLGYRISRDMDPQEWMPGGVLSLGCSFTFGDDVEAEETFTYIIGDSLGLPSYNYGACSFSSIHALLKAKKLDEMNILEKLKPKYVILGCWKELLSRSISPFPPSASSQLPLAAAYLKKEKGKIEVKASLRTKYTFEIIDMYHKEGTELTIKKFMTIFMLVPRYIYLKFLNNRLYTEYMSNLTGQENEITGYDIYDYYFSEIIKIFKKYNSRIIVLYMPYSQNDSPDQELIRVLKKYEEITLVDGLSAIREKKLSDSEFLHRHPQPKAHKAYAMEIIRKIKEKIAVWEQ